MIAYVFFFLHNHSHYSSNILVSCNNVFSCTITITATITFWFPVAGTARAHTEVHVAPLRVRKLDTVFAQQSERLAAAKVSRRAHDGNQPMAPLLSSGAPCVCVSEEERE